MVSIGGFRARGGGNSTSGRLWFQVSLLFRRWIYWISGSVGWKGALFPRKWQTDSRMLQGRAVLRLVPKSTGRYYLIYLTACYLRASQEQMPSRRICSRLRRRALQPQPSRHAARSARSRISAAGWRAQPWRRPANERRRPLRRPANERWCRRGASPATLDLGLVTLRPARGHRSRGARPGLRARRGRPAEQARQLHLRLHQGGRH